MAASSPATVRSIAEVLRFIAGIEGLERIPDRMAAVVFGAGELKKLKA